MASGGRPTGRGGAGCGRLASIPLCVSRSAAMKIMSSTSSTSMSGVTFMSAVGRMMKPRLRLPIRPRTDKKAAPAERLPPRTVPDACVGLLAAARGRLAGGLLPHPERDDADLVDADAFRGVDDVHDLAVPHGGIADDEHRFLFPRLEDVAQAVLQLGHRDRLMVDRDLFAGAVLEDDLGVVRVLLRGRLRLERQVDVDPPLGQREGRHEDDEQHEQHVDERRHVHVRRRVRDFGRDDLFGAEVFVRVLHYWPPPDVPVAPPLFFCSVMSAMLSICALRSASITSMIALYFAS